MKNTRRKSMKGGGCACSSGSLLGFPQSGGQMKKSRMNYGSSEPMNPVGEAMPEGSLGQLGRSSGYEPSVIPMRRKSSASQMPQSNISATLSSIQSRLNSINAKLNSSPRLPAQSSGLFGGGQKGGFLGLFENKPQEMTVQPPMMDNSMNQSASMDRAPLDRAPLDRASMDSVPSAQNIVKMPAVTATNTGSANERIRNLEERLAKMESSKGGYAFFGGGRKRKTHKKRKINKKRKSSRK